MRNDKQSEEVLIEKAVKTTAEVLYDKRLFDDYDNAVERLKDHLLFDEVNERRRTELKEQNDDVIQ